VAFTEPSIEEVEQSIVELLRDEEMGTLGTLSEDGYPHTSTMHFACDGLVAYFHTFKYTRKYADILRDPKVSYAIAHLPEGGFFERMQTHALQVRGMATIVEDQAEIDHAVELSHQQFDWLKETTMYDMFKNPPPQMRQVFFRVDPQTAMWNDNRVRMMWRQNLKIESGHLTEMEPYDMSGSGPSPLESADAAQGAANG